jgi:hypothetical protein
VFDNCKVVKVDGNGLFRSRDGNEHSCEVASDAKITEDGKAAKLADPEAGMKAKVTARNGEGHTGDPQGRGDGQVANRRLTTSAQVK